MHRSQMQQQPTRPCSFSLPISSGHRRVMPMSRPEAQVSTSLLIIYKIVLYPMWCHSGDSRVQRSIWVCILMGRRATGVGVGVCFAGMFRGIFRGYVSGMFRGIMSCFTCNFGVCYGVCFGGMFRGMFRGCATRVPFLNLSPPILQTCIRSKATSKIGGLSGVAGLNASDCLNPTGQHVLN